MSSARTAGQARLSTSAISCSSIFPTSSPLRRSGHRRRSSVPSPGNQRRRPLRFGCRHNLRNAFQLSRWGFVQPTSPPWLLRAFTARRRGQAAAARNLPRRVILCGLSVSVFGQDIHRSAHLTTYAISGDHKQRNNIPRQRALDRSFHDRQDCLSALPSQTALEDAGCCIEYIERELEGQRM